ncbi:MAG: ABC transporter substrate binding protein [Pseudolabrys sp.]
MKRSGKAGNCLIPIVFAVAADLVGNGLVASLARPGGNITGLSLQQSDIVGKKLELLHEVLGGLRRLAIMGNVGNPAAVLETSEVRVAASRLGLNIIALDIHRAEDIVPAFETIKGRADALYVSSDPLVLILLR